MGMVVVVVVVNVVVVVVGVMAGDVVVVVGCGCRKRHPAHLAAFQNCAGYSPEQPRRHAMAIAQNSPSDTLKGNGDNG